MPYIKQEQREELLKYKPSDTGELNYILTCRIKEYVFSQGLSYKTINDVVGALECCKHEFIRRIVNPYEEKKLHINGDVYDN